MIADVIIWGITSKMSSGFNKDFSGFPGQRPDMASSTDSEADDSDGSNKPDFSNFEGMTPPGDGEKPDFSSSDGERPSFPDGEKPDFSNSDGERPSFPDGEKSDFSNSDGEKPDFSNFENGMTPPGNMKGKGFLFSIKKFCLPILIICILVDAFSIIMLVLAIKSNKSGPDDPENGDNIDGYDNNNYTDSNTDNPQTPRHNSRIAMIVVPVLVIGIITTLGILTKNKNETATTGVAADETVMEASLEEASMSSVISAGGSVTTEESENDYYPEGIEISKYYVKEGDTVSEGDLIADVDKVSVMNTIKTVEDTIESLDKELESVSDEATENITASAGGRIKKIYASEGGAVKDTVRDNGALMVLSLDGCMAVDIESDEKINIGEKVEVTVGDDEVSGRVTALKDQIITVTIDDEYGSVDENAKVTYEDKELGSGSLYVHQALQMTGYEGTVSEICVAENEEISKGDTVIKLTDGAYSAKYEQLLKQREKLEKERYEEQLLELEKLL